LNEILPRRSAARLRPVLYNSWEATHFDVDEAGQKALAAKAAQLGVERFVMDDGWFGARDSSHAGLGDWSPSPRKFPHGLQPLIAYVKSLGMDFGLWVEPEMVNPDSDLYRAHPDWVMHFPDTPRSEARNQLVLNMSRPEVKEYVFTALDRLLSENEIAFLKWDLNRGFSEPGWPEAKNGEQRRIWVSHTRNVYEVMDRLRARHPALEIESCASGGGRVDLGILTRTEQVWPSDNTDAFDRLSIQSGFSYAYAPKIMMSWVTDVPTLNRRSTPLEYRFLVAMMGSLGIGANLLKWDAAEMNVASRLVSFYKSIRNTVQHGDLYRLALPGAGPVTASEYLSQDGKQAVLFAFLHTTQYGRTVPAVRFTALDEKARYRIRQEGAALVNAPESAGGAYLMNQGLILNLAGDFDAAAVVLTRE
jgi:alpha-galactosidase